MILPIHKNKAVTDLSQTDLLQDNHRSVFETVKAFSHSMRIESGLKSKLNKSNYIHINRFHTRKLEVHLLIMM